MRFLFNIKDMTVIAEYSTRDHALVASTLFKLIAKNTKLMTKVNDLSIWFRENHYR